MTTHISAFFDTRVGAKAEAQSYRKISTAISCEPREVLFVSDAVKEIGAARSAGMQALLCQRQSHASTAGSAQVIYDFDGIFPDWLQRFSATPCDLVAEILRFSSLRQANSG